MFPEVTSTTNKNEELSRSSTILPITDRTIPVSTLVTENWEEAVVVVHETLVIFYI